MSTVPQLSYANIGSSLDKVTSLGLAPGRKPVIVKAQAKPAAKPAAPKPVVQQAPVDLESVGKPEPEFVQEEKAEVPKVKRTSGYATVKAVLSGDTIVVLGAAASGSSVAPEKVITISGITAPKFGRGKTGVDEPFGWEAREFLRKKIIGAQVQFTVQHTSDSGRDYGVVKLNGVDLATEIVRAGYAEVKKSKTDKIPQEKESLHLLQQEAETLGIGKWRLKHMSDEQKKDVIRQIRWDEDNKQLYQRSKGIALPAIIDQVRDGSTFRVEIHGLNGLQHDIITLYLAGVQCPRTPLPKSVRDANAATAALKDVKIDDENADDIAAATKIDKKKKGKDKKGDKKEEEAAPAPKKEKAAPAPARPARQPQPADDEGEPYGIEAQQFVEARLLHRDVHVVLQGLDKFGNIFGSIQYPKGNIAIKLLEKGYGKYVPWSAQITSDSAKLKEAETIAKKNRIGLFQSYTEPEEKSATVPEYFGKVIQVHSGDTLTIAEIGGDEKEHKVSLASLRAPRVGVRGGKDEPLSQEAKEFLRSRLIGHKVKVINEYTRAPPKESGDQTVRQHVSVFLPNKVNVSEGLLSAGLAEVVRHRKDEDRSIHYEEYVAAENRAKELKKGMHGGAVSSHRIVDLSIRAPLAADSKEASAAAAASGGRKGSTASNGGDNKLQMQQRASHSTAARWAATLKQKGEINAVVEHVFSGARVKVWIPAENLMIAFVLAGVKVPTAKTKDGKRDEFGEQALQFTKQRVLQYNVKLEVENVDKGSNFIGNLYTNKQNLAELLLTEGLAELFDYSAKSNSHYEALKTAEAQAKDSKKGLWKNWVPPTESEVSSEPIEHKEFKEGSDLIKINVTEIIDAATFFAQIVDDKPLELIQQRLAEFAESVPEQTDDFEVKTGRLYAGQFTVDDAWYRVRVEGKMGDEYRAFFVDYGNHDLLDISRLRALPEEIGQKIPDSAHLCFLAGVQAPRNPDYRENAISAFTDLVWERQLLAKIELADGYGRDRRLHVTLQDETSENVTVNQQIIKDGWARVLPRVPGKLKDLQNSLKSEEKIARDAHYGVWEYGNVSDEDEEETIEKNKRR